ncbi:LamG domain-containing protein [Streptomyces sp. NPDC000410]|uniref:LamG domain-containing protein n=1 Tax=Streptomyces sp. NPDC000410 TaxID=3154254 RepID=UPI00331A755E
MPAVSADPARAADPPPAGEEHRALARAAETGERVEVVGARTEFETTYANPDGTSFRLEQSVVPVRVRGESGAWLKPDATLEKRSDGTVGPKASAVDLAFSGGGDGAGLVKIAREGRTLAFGWPGKLPAPTLDGDSAVYANVLPDVDLRMTATAEGFHEVLVVKTPKAAAGPKLKKITFSMNATRLKVSPTEGGGFGAVDANATQVFTAPPALMWDSSGASVKATATTAVGAASARTAKAAPAAADDNARDNAHDDADRPKPGAATADLPIQVGKNAISLVPDAKMLQETDASAFPLYIDPTVAWGEAERTLLRSDGYEDYGWGNGSDDQGVGVGKCGSWNGYYCGPGYVQRVYFEFSPSPLAGKHILDASFRVTEPWAFQCDPRWVDLVRTNNISSSTTWSSRPSELDLMVDRNVSAGRGSLCDPDQPDAPIEFNDSPDEANENLTPTVRAFAAGKFSRLTLMIRAHDEGDPSAWKRFKNDAVLVVDYVGKPYFPSPHGFVAGVGTVCSKDGDKPSTITDPTPQVAANVRTYSGGEAGALLKAGFRIERLSGTTWVRDQPDFLSPTGTSYLGAGKRATPSVPTALVEGPLYRLSAWTNSYWNNFNHLLSSGNAGVCYFKVDPTAPKAPAITPGSVYTLCTTTACDPAGGPGTEDQFTFAPAAGDTNSAYQFKRSGTEAWSAAIAGATVKQKIIPEEAGTYYLEARAKDAAGRWGASQIVSFLVKEGAGPVGRWHFDEESGAAIDSSTTVAANQDNATLSAGAGRDDRGRRGELWYDDKGEPLAQPRTDKALHLNGTSGYAATSGSVLETRSAYTISAWVRLSPSPDGVVVLSQDGSKYSPFLLSYLKPQDKWFFGVKEKDEDTGKAYFGALSKQPAQENVWTHIAGTYDPSTGSIQLYVNGVHQATSTVTGSWAATGGLQIGRYKWANVYQRYFSGSIDEAAVWQRALQPGEIATEARTLSSKSGLTDVELVAAWSAQGATGTAPVGDTSGYGRNLSLAGGASFDGESIVLDGSDDAATTAGPVLDDTGSFTVTTTVQLDSKAIEAKDIGYIGQVVGQRTADGSSWGLWFELTGKEQRFDDDLVEHTVPVGSWRFGRVNKDGTQVWAASEEEADLGTPVRLTGVFDALSEQGPVARLYVGSEQKDADKPYSALVGSGDFAVGKGFSATDWGHYVTARIGEVRLWAGAMTGSEQIDKVIGD